MDGGQPVVTVVKEKGVSPEKVVRLFLAWWRGYDMPV